VFDTRRRTPRLGPYLFRRSLRIYPAYWLAALVIAYGFGVSPYVDLADAIEHLSLVHIYTDENVISGPIFQAWSLGTEVSFYLAVPLFGWLARRIGRRTAGRLAPQLLFVAALIAVATLYRFWIEETQGLMSGAYLTWLPGYLDQFAGGMALAVIVAWASAGHRLPSWLASSGVAIGCWITGLAILYATTHIGISPTDLSYTTSQQMARQGMYAAYSTLLVFPAVFGAGRSPVERFLRAPGLRHLGLVSYGIYLWHVFFIDRYQRWSDTPLFGGNFEDALLFTFVASTLTATVSYALVERPILQLKRLWPAR
jgi:peptidoglycan/LPS O-acetylase OafA/YrhL